MEKKLLKKISERSKKRYYKIYNYLIGMSTYGRISIWSASMVT